MMLATDSFVEIYIYRFGRRNYLARQSCKIRIPKMVIEGPIPDMYNTLAYICIYILIKLFVFLSFAIAKSKIDEIR